MIRALVLALLLLLPASAGAATVTYPQTAYVYATISGILRQIVVPGINETVTLLGQPGETVVVQAGGSPIDEASIRAAITIAIGKPIASDHCAVVDNTNKVVSVIRCDPALDAVSGRTLVQHPLAVTGDTWAGGSVFKRIFAVVNPVTHRVEQLVSLSIDTQIPPVGRVLYPADSLNVGDTVGFKP